MKIYLRKVYASLKPSFLKLVLSAIVLAAIGFAIYRVVRADAITMWLVLDAFGEVFLALALLLTEFGLFVWVFVPAIIGVVLEVREILGSGEWNFPVGDILLVFAVVYLARRNKSVPDNRNNSKTKGTDTSDAFRQVQELSERGDYRKALDALEGKKIALHKDFHFFWWRGLLEFKTDEAEKALQSLNIARSMSKKPNSALDELYGQVLYAMGNFETARGVFEANSKIGYRVSASLANLAATEFCLGNFENARHVIEQYEDSRTQMKSEPAIMYLKGLILEALRRHAEAEIEYRQAMELNWKNCQILARLASLLVEEGKWEESYSTLHECVESAGTSNAEFDDALSYLQIKDHSAPRPWVLSDARDWTREDRREWASFPVVTQN